MDYTLSPQHVVHPGTGHRMHDQAQAIPTQVTDKDLNQVTWSLMQVLSAAGVAGQQFNPNDPETYNRVRVAMATLMRRNYGSVAVAAGTADAITAVFDPVVVALVDGLVLRVRAGAMNATTTPTFKADGTDAKIITKGYGVPLDVGDIAGAGHWLTLQYDALADKWMLLNPANGTSSIPAGMLAPFAGETAPDGWLKANGSVPLIADVPRIAARIYCGNANNATAQWGYRCTNPLSANTSRDVAGLYIVLPDARGRTVRGLSDGSAIDIGRLLWTYQEDAFQGHWHNARSTGNITMTGDSAIEDGPRTGLTGDVVTDAISDGVNGTPRVAAETRMKNFAALWCIKK